MKVATMFLIGFIIGFGMISGGSMLFGYGIDGPAIFLGSFIVGAATAFLAANN